jgi:cellulose synthase/poly-beta-1,6-N-acetylglucosamine synthase-like glycosyltransferase
MVDFLFGVLDAFNYLVLLYFLALNSVYLVMSSIAFRSLRGYAIRLKTFDFQNLLTTIGAPPITIVAPAYNEEATCVESVRSLLTLTYPEYEILVVNDGSRDTTLDTLIDAFGLVPAARLPTASIPASPVRAIYQSARHPNLWVIDKRNGGKADALNAGLNYCATPFFCAIDADSLLERDALVRIVRPFLEDETTIAAGGIIRIVNGCRVRAGTVTRVGLPTSLVARFQVLEYLRAFLAGRMGLSEARATLIISGAFGLFRRSTVIAAGGFASSKTSGETVGEDMELVVRLQRYCLENEIPYRVTFIPDPAAWTECPESLKILRRQRDRWQRGLVESLVRHRKMLLNPRYGRIGLFGFPYFFFLEMLGPMIELGGYVTFTIAVVLGRASSVYMVAFLLLAIVFGIVLSVAAIGLEELTFRRYPRLKDLTELFVLAVLENFGFRQMSTFWRAKGIISAMRGKAAWGKMERRGFAVEHSPEFATD